MVSHRSINYQMRHSINDSVAESETETGISFLANDEYRQAIPEDTPGAAD